MKCLAIFIFFLFLDGIFAVPNVIAPGQNLFGNLCQSQGYHCGELIQLGDFHYDGVYLFFVTISIMTSLFPIFMYCTKAHPHPKFSIAHMKWSILTHIVGGSSEVIFLSIFPFFLTENLIKGGGVMYVCMFILLVSDWAHSISCGLMFPHLFGQRLLSEIMYSYCIILKSISAILTFVSFLQGETSQTQIHLWNTFWMITIFGYFRFFYVVTEAVGIFEGSRYTVATLCSGILPLMMTQKMYWLIFSSVWGMVYWFTRNQIHPWVPQDYQEHSRDFDVLKYAQKNIHAFHKLFDVAQKKLDLHSLDHIEFTNFLFDILDFTEYQKLPFGEFFQFVGSFGISDATCHKMFENIDTSHDGFLELEEFHRFMDDNEQLQNYMCENIISRCEARLDEFEQWNEGLGCDDIEPHAGPRLESQAAAGEQQPQAFSDMEKLN
jgi:hypothetical protein